MKKPIVITCSILAIFFLGFFTRQFIPAKQTESAPLKKVTYRVTQWSAFSDSTKYFNPSVKEFMINYRVKDLVTLVTELKKESVTILDSIETYDYGKFVHILDNEENKIELWEPVDANYDNIVNSNK